MILARLEGGGGAATSSLSGLGARVGGGGGAPPPSLNENERQMENSRIFWHLGLSQSIECNQSAVLHVLRRLHLQHYWLPRGNKDDSQ